MGILYENLDETVRKEMINEVVSDQRAGTLYISPRLSEEGAEAWPRILSDACQNHDDLWIASILRSRQYMRNKEKRCKSNGGFSMVKVPHTAPDTLAEGEFNRFYIRGLCAEVLLSDDEAEVEVYRGKTVTKSRPQSEGMIGLRLSAKQLLDDLRISQGIDTALGLPPGPNSGLTVRRCMPNARP